MITEGSAYLDGSGRVLAADASFLAMMQLAGGEPDALRTRASSEPALAALLDGRGPDTVAMPGGEGELACELTRVSGGGGLLLRARSTGATLPAPALEYAMQALALARLAGSVAHEVKNPLNAMALQLALLGDKIASANEALAASCAGNLASLKTQIGRVNETVRRYLDVADPGPSGGVDAGALLRDAAALFGHEARRRRIALACEAPPGVRAGVDPSRAARLVAGLLWRAVQETAEGGRLDVRAAQVGAEASLAIEHARGRADPALAWVGEVVASSARALGGRLEDASDAGAVRLTLLLPKERPL